MEIKFWTPSREYFKYKTEFDNAIQGCLSRGELVLGYGEEIVKFEKSFADFIGVKHAIMCGGGTHALKLAYKALGIGPGDEVITTSHTFIATIDQIVDCGATPILVDIDPVTGLIDPAEIEKAITPKTKAIVPVHLEGKVCDMGKILDLATTHNLYVVEDSAQAIGAKDKCGCMAGSMGDIGCYSMFPAKVLGSFGNSGMVVTNDDLLAQKLRMLRCNYNAGKNQNIDEVDWGVQLEPDAIQAAVLNVKLKYLPERLQRREEIAKKYDEAFMNYDIRLPHFQAGRIYQDYVMLVENPEALRDFLKEKGIGTLGVGMIPNHFYPKLGLKFILPYTEGYLKRQIRLPLNPDLTDEEVEYIIKSVKEFYAQG